MIEIAELSQVVQVVGAELCNRESRFARKLATHITPIEFKCGSNGLNKFCNNCPEIWFGNILSILVVVSLS
jgi:hypothetical protein